MVHKSREACQIQKNLCLSHHYCIHPINSNLVSVTPDPMTPIFVHLNYDALCGSVHFIFVSLSWFNRCLKAVRNVVFI